MPGRWAQLRDRYVFHVLATVAVVLAIIVPLDARTAVWNWLLKNVSAMDVLLVVGGFRLMSMAEHRKTFLKLAGLDDKLDNGIKARLGRIEEKLGIEPEQESP